jgi:hypothetical protein
VSDNMREQFVYSDYEWLNGFDLNSQKVAKLFESEKKFVFAFYNYYGNKAFVVGIERKMFL